MKESTQREILQLYYENKGHMGIERTYLSISEKYYWNDMYKNVLEYVETCAVCQKCGSFPKTVEELHPIPIQSPWHHVCIDLEKCQNQHQGIITL